MLGFCSVRSDVTLRSVSLLDLPPSVRLRDVKAFVFPGGLPIVPEHFPYGCEPIGLNGAPSRDRTPGIFWSVRGLRLPEHQQFQLIAYLEPSREGTVATPGRVRFTFDKRFGRGSQTLDFPGGVELAVRRDADPAYLSGGFSAEGPVCDL